MVELIPILQMKELRLREVKWLIQNHNHLVTKVNLNLSRLGKSLAVQWLGLGAFTARALIRSLVGEVRSHKLHGTAKIIKKNPILKNNNNNKNLSGLDPDSSTLTSIFYYSLQSPRIILYV